MDGWLICTVTAACTVVKPDAGLSESWFVSRVSTESTVVMDVVSSEARCGLPSELLYADELVLMVPTMEQLGRRVGEWRASLLDKGVKVNAGKSKVMVGSSGGKMVSVEKYCRQTMFSAHYV